MGLWTVKHILDKHHGDVRVQSKQGEGTCFTLWWPRRYEAAKQSELLTR
jgi:signal transduction histidine kinase